MLQATAVIRAAALKSGRKAVVSCNNHANVFLAMPEVVEVVPLVSAAPAPHSPSLFRGSGLTFPVRSGNIGGTRPGHLSALCQGDD
jgi:hypothetical protein